MSKVYIFSRAGFTSGFRMYVSLFVNDEKTKKFIVLYFASITRRTRGIESRFLITIVLKLLLILG